MGIKGDFAGLARLQAKLKSLASEDTHVRLANVLGAEAITQIQLGFRSSRDPYGVPWAPLKRRSGKPLLDTGRLRSSFSYNARRGSFVVGTNVSYAKFHQHGTAGRSKASQRFQPIDKHGRFASKTRSGRVIVGSRKGRGLRLARGAVSFKSLNFQAGGGAIPQRMMVPEGTMGRIWKAAFDATAKRFVSRLMRK